LGRQKDNEQKNDNAEENLLLLAKNANNNPNRVMAFLALIQDGNIVVRTALDPVVIPSFYTFTTDATWCLPQAITSAIADHPRPIGIPVHMIETINKLVRTTRQLVQEIGREPTPEEIAVRLELPVDKVRKVLKIAKEPISLETPIGEEKDGHLGD